MFIHTAVTVLEDDSDPQKAPISVPHPEPGLHELLRPLRWGVGDPRGAKGRKDTWGVEEVAGEDEEGGGSAEEVLWGDDWVCLDWVRPGDAEREGTLWMEARAVGGRSVGPTCWQAAKGARRRVVGGG